MSVRRIRRAFVDIEHGQIHCRIAVDPTAGKQAPLLMLHGGPGSSAGLVPMIEVLVAHGADVIAPDLMGNGQSDPPPVTPDMAFYVDCVLMLLDRLGVRKVDCYGHHAGAQIACDLAIRAPDRVGKLVLDGVGLFSEEQRHEFIARYAPPVRPEQAGDHLYVLWNFLSATTTRFPHYSEETRHLIPGGAPLPPAILTDQFADVVRNWRTYHLSYCASFTEDLAARLPLVQCPVTILRVTGDPLACYAESAAALLADASVVPAERASRANAIARIMHTENR